MLRHGQGSATSLRGLWLYEARLGERGGSTDDSRVRLMLVTLGFLRLEGELPPVLLWLHRWLDTWRGIGHLAVGMARQDFDLQLTRYDEQGRRATFLCDRNGALTDERDRDGLGTDAVGRSPAGRLGGAQQRCPAWRLRGSAR